MTLKPVTLITGASAGIGAAFARVFAAHGHETALVARRLAQLETVADGVAAAHGRRPHVLAIDLLQADGPERVAGELAARGLEPAIVVNNAGFGLRGAAADLDRAQQLAMIDLNVRVLTDLSLRFVESLQRHHGGIINMASISSYFPGPEMAVYFAGKAYVLSFSEALRQELKPLGIKVTAVCPGPVPLAPGVRRDRRSPARHQHALGERVARDSRQVMRGNARWYPALPTRSRPCCPGCCRAG